MAKLFTTYFDSGNPLRQRELACAIGGNCDAFDHVFVVSQGAPAIEQAGPNCTWIIQNERQTFRQLLNLAAAETNPGETAVLANSDIMVQGWALRKAAECLQVNQVYALSRWDFLARGVMLFDRRDSQDCWMFNGPPKDTIEGNYPFGYPGVDNRLAAELKSAGYTVLNPSRDITTYHCHLTQHRTSNDAQNRVALPYLFVAPHRLGEAAEYSRPIRISKRAGYFQK